jgi:hypothetical protein
MQNAEWAEAHIHAGLQMRRAERSNEDEPPGIINSAFSILNLHGSGIMTRRSGAVNQEPPSRKLETTLGIPFARLYCDLPLTYAQNPSGLIEGSVL